MSKIQHYTNLPAGLDATVSLCRSSHYTRIICKGSPYMQRFPLICRVANKLFGSVPTPLCRQSSAVLLPALLPAKIPALRPALLPAKQPALRPALPTVKIPALLPAEQPAVPAVKIPVLLPAEIPALLLAEIPAILPAEIPALRPALPTAEIHCTSTPTARDTLTVPGTLHCWLRSSLPLHSTGIFRSYFMLPEFHSANPRVSSTGFYSTHPLHQHLHCTQHSLLHLAPCAAGSAPVHHPTLQVSSVAIPAPSLPLC